MYNEYLMPNIYFNLKFSLRLSLHSNYKIYIVGPLGLNTGSVLLVTVLISCLLLCELVHLHNLDKLGHLLLLFFQLLLLLLLLQALHTPAKELQLLIYTILAEQIHPNQNYLMA